MFIGIHIGSITGMDFVIYKFTALVYLSTLLNAVGCNIISIDTTEIHVSIIVLERLFLMIVDIRNQKNSELNGHTAMKHNEAHICIS